MAGEGGGTPGVVVHEVRRMRLRFKLEEGESHFVQCLVLSWGHNSLSERIRSEMTKVAGKGTGK